MEFASIVVIILRIIIPISILRYPLFGIIAAWFLDAVDLFLVSMLGGSGYLDGSISEYHQIDKLLDIYYLFFVFIVALGWKDKLARGAIIFFFGLRLVGTILFLFMGQRMLLFFFPGFLTEFFIFYLVVRKIWPSFYFKNLFSMVIFVLIIAIPKMFFEYFFHFQQMSMGEMVSRFTPFKVGSSAESWEWIKTKLLLWIK